MTFISIHIMMLNQHTFNYLLIETDFKICLGEPQNSGVCLILEFFYCNVKLEARLTSAFLTVSDNRWSCSRSIFQGNRAIKTCKTISRLVHNIVLEILDH